MITYSYQNMMDIYVEKFRRYLQLNTALPHEIIDSFVNVIRPKKYNKGEFFSKQGEFSDKSAYICAGIFNVFSTQEDGTLFVVSFLKDDDFIQSRFDTSSPGNVTIQALCDSVVIEIKTTMINDLYLQYPQLGSFARRTIEKYLVVYAAHMIQNGTMKSLDNYLLFKKKFQREEDNIPQHLIAAYLGITPTQLSRVRRKLSSETRA
jgi:CRP-like cAMP-binding protein